MTKRNFGSWVVLSVMLGVLITGIGLAADAPKFGGTLRYATIGTPPTLDEQVVTADITTTIMQHVFEGLFTFTEKSEAVPMLAENYEVKDGGKLIVIGLRQNVPFHNGKEMTSADVVASLIRWGKFGVRGPVLFKHVEKVEADGKYGVKIYFKQPFAPWKNFLAYI
ncbi:MAG: ABC transporter substrate-binding protein, partial [Anaerolineales bacterium]|nr:ABC transporter substrate-binding protein [Anaerolineales bacterium]